MSVAGRLPIDGPLRDRTLVKIWQAGLMFQDNLCVDTRQSANGAVYQH